VLKPIAAPDEGWRSTPGPGAAKLFNRDCP